jgi:hypothetical protein
MRIIAYTFEADYHCLDCTETRFPDMEGTDSEGNSIHPLFSTDEWCELDKDFLAEHPVQYIECGDCLNVIDSYTHNTESV